MACFKNAIVTLKMRTIENYGVRSHFGGGGLLYLYMKKQGGFYWGGV